MARGAAMNEDEEDAVARSAARRKRCLDIN
jgi:hypothetical protein